MTHAKLRFRFSPEKFADVVVFFASQRIADLTTLKLVKLIYLADRQHLLSHGRPILGDWYTPMRHGPVPSKTYDLLKGLRDEPEWVPAVVADLKTKVKKVERAGASPCFVCAGDPGELLHLSPSDIEALEQTASRHAHQPVGRLIDITHEHLAWRRSWDNNEHAMDYELFFADADDPDAQAMLELARLEHQDRLAFDLLGS